jgi:glycosyltransferase involved in cell wall biosynthesis
MDQTFDNFEVVICDDQSADGTLAYARALAKGDKRFRFIPNPCRFGLGGNWNNCVKYASGEWIKFVFQDDIIKPTCLESLLTACNSEGKLFGFCERDVIFENGTPQAMQDWFIGHKRRLKADYQAGPVVSAEQVVRLAVRDLSQNLVGEPVVTLISKQLFQASHGFDDALIQLCDWDLWFRVMVNHGAAFIPRSLAVFRVHAETTTVRNQEKREFRMGILDRLVLRYKFAFDKHFKSARDPHLTGTSILSLRKECAALAAAAWSQARNSDKCGNNPLIEEWTNVISHYPGLQIIAGLGTVFALGGRIKRGIRHYIR